MAIIKKKVMGKPMKKAQNGAATNKKTSKTYPILSEEGDLADALNETIRMRKAGTAPKTNAGGMKVMDRFQKEGKLGPAKPMMKPKAKSGGSFPDLNKDGKVTKADILKGRGVIAKKGAKMAKCKYGCK